MSDPATVSISMPRVHTLQVTVRTLRIGTKQVTQSVFRQLPRRSVWEPMTGTLRGQPWGTVNYFWGDCTNDHLHVVWQEGERLFRDCVYEPTHRKPEGLWRLQDRIDQLDALLSRGALFILALWMVKKGWTLEPVMPPKQFKVHWPCGVESTIAVPMRSYTDPHASYSKSELSKALANVFQARSTQSVEHRQSKQESSNTKHRPPGEGWIEHLPQQNYAPQHRWTRYREETDQEYAERRGQELTNTYGLLQRALTIEGDTQWDLDPLPTDVESAKQALDAYAEQWRISGADMQRLQQQFLTVYAQLRDLDQLFIAV